MEIAPNMLIPDYVTHYHPVGDPPFRNLSELPEHQREPVISMLVQRRRQNQGFHRIFSSKYIPLRLVTETKLRDMFIESGGKPERLAPHYFVLGSSMWFKGLYPQTGEVVIPLSDLHEHTTSITYPDSFVSMRLGEPFGVKLEPLRPYHNKVYRLSELPKLVHQYGLPVDEIGSNYANYGSEPFEKYIEVHVWSDEPVAKYLN